MLTIMYADTALEISSLELLSVGGLVEGHLLNRHSQQHHSMIGILCICSLPHKKYLIKCFSIPPFYKKDDHHDSPSNAPTYKRGKSRGIEFTSHSTPISCFVLLAHHFAWPGLNQQLFFCPSPIVVLNDPNSIHIWFVLLPYD